MTLHTLDTGLFKLDGGAMFGVVPKVIWHQLNPADENNLCTWAMRCLLLEDGNRLTLVDTGMGNKQDANFFRHYYPHGDDTLAASLARLGFAPADVTDVWLTHLHFDHAGGAVTRHPDGALAPTFANATYWSNAAHWQWATHPNPREKPSFLADNILPIAESGQLKFYNPGDASLIPGVEAIFVDGHTEKMMLPKIRLGGQTVLFLADLIPSAAHVPLNYVMGYDLRPLLTMDEKARVLQAAADEGHLLVFQHDARVACATVAHTEKGVRIQQRGTLAEMLA